MVTVLDELDQEYIDAVLDTALQDIRHQFDVTNEQAITMLKDSVERFEE